ncbi:NAD(P)-dependent oxidoreductase [Pseudoalteromonas sp. A25]|uniref:NADP-binding protein n=1 Tax=Pseudoalteromonas sp. A25 TaxID=116092 RepID=UPI00126054BF|nr:NADP-binding protein [Pseudoalteromonas sp. A25]BBN82805.1 NAD(P)-dependent oxidoreductase [Pseudoalteromonas sp. A25]
MNKLVVLGAGWLGKPLCLQAKAKGWQVEGTRTQLRNNSESYERVFCLNDDKLESTISLENAWWVCAVPPRARQKESNYLRLLNKALSLSNSFKRKGFLLCSSTGVYPSEAQTYTEQCDVFNVNLSPRQSILVEAEKMVLGHGGKLLRLAGLVGPSREPGRFVAAKQLTSSSQSLVNMVHQQDVLNAIFCVLENWQQAEDIYNVCHPSHPTRLSYYQQKCAHWGSALPTFASDEAVARVVDGSGITALGFSYQHEI